MSSEKKFDIDSLPTLTLGHEKWIQCHLRLILRFQANYGIPLYEDELRSRYPRISVDDIYYSFVGQAIYNAMLGVEIRDEFQVSYLEHREELDSLGAKDAERLAFNLAMDESWEQIERVASDFGGMPARLGRGKV